MGNVQKSDSYMNIRYVQYQVLKTNTNECIYRMDRTYFELAEADFL
jgi:hypothetical protein